MKNICLIISLLGILFLLFYINLNEPKTINISLINSNHLDKQVKIRGQIIPNSIKTYENNFTILNIQDSTGQIQAVCSCQNIKQYQNQTLEIIGTIQEYKNNLQINADKIKLLR